MSQVKISGNASGTGVFEIAAPNSNTNRTQTLVDATGTIVLDSATQTLTNKTISGGLWTAPAGSTLTSGTATSATGTAVNFTGIPSWVKRITVMFNGVSTNGTSFVQVQLGDSGGVETSGYTGVAAVIANTGTGITAALSAGFLTDCYATYYTAAATRQGSMVLTHLGSNTWTVTSEFGMSGTGVNSIAWTGGSKTLSDVLTQVRITTVNGTDTFDAGSINILYEG